MPQDLEFTVDEVTKHDNTPLGVQTYTLIVSYRGEVDLTDQIVQGENLSIEIPSHAPPPEK